MRASRDLSGSGRTPSSPLDDHRHGLAAADTKCRKTALFAEIAQSVQQRDEHARAGSADGMAEGDGAAAYVDGRWIETGEPRAGERDARERLVDFPEVDVLLVEA